MLWRTSTSGALWALDSDGTPRARLGRSILCPLGISGRLYRAVAAGDSHLHRAAGGSGTHAASTISHLHISRVVAVVLGTSILRHEAGRELARVGEIFSPVRRGDWAGAGSRSGLVCVESLAE